MTARLFGMLNACLVSIAFSANAHAALATAGVTFDWSTFDTATSGDLVATMVAPMGDDGSAYADDLFFEADVTTGFGGITLLVTTTPSSGFLLTTPDLIDASASSAFGVGGANFERFFSFEATSGSGNLSLSVDVEIQAEVQGTGTIVNSDALFGYEVGTSGVVASRAGLEMNGNSGDQSQTLSTTLSFSVFMEQGDVIDMFAEGGPEVSAIPIPAAAWLFGSGLIGLVGISRRKRVTT